MGHYNLPEEVEPPECPDCGEDMEETERAGGVINYRCFKCRPFRPMDHLSNPTEPEHCQSCWVETTRYCWHHVSYKPEVVVPVCWSCHTKIHVREEFRPDLTPKMTRGEAEDRGYI